MSKMMRKSKKNLNMNNNILLKMIQLIRAILTLMLVKLICLSLIKVTRWWAMWMTLKYMRRHIMRKNLNRKYHKAKVTKKMLQIYLQVMKALFLMKGNKRILKLIYKLETGRFSTYSWSSNTTRGVGYCGKFYSTLLKWCRKFLKISK